ncbi:alpha/beta hydrolase [candidate division WOR-3 bacterium]|nr:alpha/beta hydrolase [candidate division WOR-3 bacterium]
MNTRKIILVSIFVFLACQRLISLDDFLFEPTQIDEYLRPEDFDDEWGTRFIIPDSLVEPVALTSMGNTIYGFFVHGHPDSATNNQVTILYCHGKDENINRYWIWVEHFWEMGYNVFIFDYQGYGKSEGSPSGEALFSDGLESLHYLQARTDIDTSKIVFYGWSLGTFVASYLAADEHHPAALIFESAPASASALLQDAILLNMPGCYVVDADFDNATRIEHVGCPFFMMHGRTDDFVVFERHVHRIWDNAVDPKRNLWIDDAGHDDIITVLGMQYHQAVIDFVNDYVF